MALHVQHDVALAPRTSLELGGRATHLVEAADEPTVIDALQWADANALPVLVLGGGSNLVVGDDGWPGLVLRMALRGVKPQGRSGSGRVWVAAGEVWDSLVQLAVERGWAGIECLSGIPGLVGATPIQNVGAYGQEIADVVTAVHVWDRREGRRLVLEPKACAFGYRDSAFKREPDRAVVLAVELQLRPGGEPSLRYAELARSFPEGVRPSLAAVRQRVLELRRGKSMVIDPDDPNRRSAGSFFTNPVVDPAVAQRVVEQALRDGLVDDPAQVPRFATEDGRIKLPAAWLIEAAGLRKGQRQGAVGISSRHALALVHHGGGRTAELLAFARFIRDEVHARFGVELRPEPVLAGVSW